MYNIHAQAIEKLPKATLSFVLSAFMEPRRLKKRVFFLVHADSAVDEADREATNAKDFEARLRRLHVDYGLSLRGVAEAEALRRSLAKVKHRLGDRRLANALKRATEAAAEGGEAGPPPSPTLQDPPPMTSSAAPSRSSWWRTSWWPRPSSRRPSAAAPGRP